MVIEHGHGGYARLRKGRASIPGQAYHITSATRDRAPVFRNLVLGRVVIGALRRDHEAGHVESLAFVVMPDHFHWLFILTGSRSLSAVLNNVKSFAARQINAIRGTRGSVWQAGFHDRAIRKDEELVAVARYIIANPLRARIVSRVEDYPLWDAVWLK